MKKIWIGGFLILSGMIGVMVPVGVAAIAPVSGWVTPPGRFICTILTNGTALPLLLSLVLLTLGLAVLTREYLNKED